MSLDLVWNLIPLVAMAAMVGLYGWLIFGAYGDMQRRGQPGWLYALVIAFMPFVGSIAWWYGRQRYPLRESPAENRHEVYRPK